MFADVVEQIAQFVTKHSPHSPSVFKANVSEQVLQTAVVVVHVAV